MKLLLLPILLSIIAFPIATAQLAPEGNFETKDGKLIEVIKEKKFDQRSNSKNYVCVTADITDELDGKEKRYKTCERKWEPCVTESYLEADEFGGFERKYRCEPNYRVDFYIEIDAANNSEVDRIYSKALADENSKPSKFDNVKISFNEFDVQIPDEYETVQIFDEFTGEFITVETDIIKVPAHIQARESVSGSFEYKTKAEVDTVRDAIKLIADGKFLADGVITVSRTWHHIEDNTIPCEVVAEQYYGSSLNLKIPSSE